MRSCYQTSGMSMIDHGHDVRAWYVDLRDSIAGDTPPKREWRLPEWIRSSRIRENLIQIDDHLMELYQVFHDCGKPLCLSIDSDGRQHFPDHAKVSRARWLECSDLSDEALEIADLIGMDMDVHLLKADRVEEFASRRQALPLLLTALSEIHSNAQMFGGIGSPGFKTKFKKIDRLGSRIIGALP